MTTEPKPYLEPLRDVGTYSPARVAEYLAAPGGALPDGRQINFFGVVGSPSGLYMLYDFHFAEGTVERYFTDRG